MESSRLVSIFGVPVLEAGTVTSEADLMTALESIGCPVALKTAMPGITHKTDVGGVVTGLWTVDEAMVAYQGLAERLGPVVSLLRHVDRSRGTERFLGMVDDAQFGPIVTIGAGGV